MTRLAVSAFERVEARVPHALVVLLLAAGAVATALRFNETTAGGSDSFSYVTQADLWLRGAADAHRHADGRGRPVARCHRDPHTVRLSVHARSPRDRAGHRAGIADADGGVQSGGGALRDVLGGAAQRRSPRGRDVHDRPEARLGRVGLAAAWLAATSPAVLAMSKSVMSDAPAAAFWALATALILCQSTAAAFGAGLSTSAAILIRPNLLPVGLVLGLWVIWRAFEARAEAESGGSSPSPPARSPVRSRPRQSTGGCTDRH